MTACHVRFGRGGAATWALLIVMTAASGRPAAAAERDPPPVERSAATDAAGDPLPASRADAERLLRAADEAYLGGEFEAAVNNYLLAARAGFGGADAWFNAGTSLWEAGRAAEAVLAWERALLRSPRHPDATLNLRLARSELGISSLNIGAPSVQERIGARLPHAALTWGFAAALVVMTSALAFRSFVSARGASLFALIAVSLVASLSLGGASALSVWYHEAVDRVVVMEPAKVRAGPSPRFPSLLDVPEGVVVRVRGYDGPYARVRLGSDREGWILRSAVEGI